MSILSVLTCVVSSTLQLPILLNIHNRCQNINLTLPAYFMHGGRWNVVPDQKIDIDTVTRNILEFDSGQNIMEGALVYKIQKRRRAKLDKSAHGESKCIQFLVAWHVNHTKGLDVRTLLVRHNKRLDEDKLRQLYQKCWYPPNVWVNTTGSNWLLDDTTVLTTTVKIMNKAYECDIFISERIKDNTIRPLWIDTER
jgi:hypothetical protein